MNEFEQVSCPLCESGQGELFLRVPDRFSDDLPDEFSLFRCLSCGMIYLNPRPVERISGRYYEHREYLPFTSTGEPGSLTEKVYRIGRRLNLRWKRRLIERYWRGGAAKGPGRLLDVGCGTGEFLVAVRRGGWSVEGLERDETASTWAARTWGLAVHTGDLGNPTGLSGPFDVITMWHVLEHLYDPRKVLALMRELLAKEGFLLIAVPNISGVDAAVYGKNWIALDTPRHVNHFSHTTLGRIAAETGFELIARKELPFDVFFNALMSEQFASRRRQSSVIVWPFRALRAALVSLLALAGGSRLFSARFGPTLVYLFRKAP